MFPTVISPWRRTRRRYHTRNTGSGGTGGIMWKPTGGNSLHVSPCRTGIMRQGSQIIRIRVSFVPARLSRRGKRRNSIIYSPGMYLTAAITGAAWISAPPISIMMYATGHPGKIIMRYFFRIPGQALLIVWKTGPAFWRKRGNLWMLCTALPSRKKPWTRLRQIWQSCVRLPVCGWRMDPFTAGKAALMMWEAVKGPVPMCGIMPMRCLFFFLHFPGASGIWNIPTASKRTADWNSVSACRWEVRAGGSIPVWTDSLAA